MLGLDHRFRLLHTFHHTVELLSCAGGQVLFQYFTTRDFLTFRWYDYTTVGPEANAEKIQGKAPERVRFKMAVNLNRL